MWVSGVVRSNLFLPSRWKQWQWYRKKKKKEMKTIRRVLEMTGNVSNQMTWRYRRQWWKQKSCLLLFCFLFFCTLSLWVVPFGSPARFLYGSWGCWGISPAPENSRKASITWCTFKWSFQNGNVYQLDSWVSSGARRNSRTGYHVERGDRIERHRYCRQSNVTHKKKKKSQ